MQNLQKRIKEGEQQWGTRLAVAQGELQEAQNGVQSLEEAIETQKTEVQEMDQWKEKVIRMKIQLAEHKAAAGAEHQNHLQEVEVLRSSMTKAQK